MEMRLAFAGEVISTLPYFSFPAFQILCQQLGFQTRWDQAERTFHLLPGLTGKIVCLVQSKSRVEQELLTYVTKFLTSSGIHCLLSDEANSSTPADLYLKLTVSQETNTEPPQTIVHYDDRHTNTRKLSRLLFQEFEKLGIPYIPRACSESPLSIPLIEIQSCSPGENQPMKWTTDRERLAVSLASGIIKYFLEDGNISPFSLLSPESITCFIKDRAFSHQKEEGFQNELRTETKRLQAEVYFDYSYHFSANEKQPHLILGNLSIKNTGDEDLYNPVILIRVTPPDSIKLRGQILPPHMTESLSIQNSMGNRGWKYLGDDWFQKAHEQGEYWIGPINDIRISAQEIERLNFQLTVTKPIQDNQVMVEGFVYFQEKQMHFSSNNRIICSYLPSANSVSKS
jgi:hypothetical protein